jgi:hypothetical protein
MIIFQQCSTFNNYFPQSKQNIPICGNIFHIYRPISQKTFTSINTVRLSTGE